MGQANARVFTDGNWITGTELAGLQAIGTTIVSKTGLNKGSYLVSVTGSCDVAFIYRFFWFASDGVTVKGKALRQPASGNEDWLAPSILHVADGDQFVCRVAINAVTPVNGLQLSILYEVVA